MQIDELPHVDDYTTVIAAEADTVWRSIGGALDRTFSGRMARYAKLAGATPTSASGPRPFEKGSTVPGFEAVEADPGHELVLLGGHRFSTYALRFRLEPVGPGQLRLHAESRATFPGLSGGLYRFAVIGTGGHGMSIRRMLTTIRKFAESPTAP